MINLYFKSLLIQIYLFEVNFFAFTGGSYFDVQTWNIGFVKYILYLQRIAFT